METTAMLEGARALLPVVLDAGWKGGLLLVALLGVARLLRRAPAATRHLVWAGGLAALVALPVLSAAVPWRLAVLPARVSSAAAPVPGSSAAAAGAAALHTVEAATMPLGPAVQPVEEAGAGEGQGSVADAGSPSGVAIHGGWRSADWGALAAVAWILGMVVIGVKVAAGWVLVWRMVRRASPLTDDAWAGELLRASERVGLARPVRLLRSEGAQVAFTTGLLRPVVVLPTGCVDWAPERRRAVLMHELAHVRRGDLATHLLGRAACALHWYNPLAWLAAKRLRAESERACDDLVLTLGTRASEYAGHLLDLVRSAGRLRAPAVVVPMAQESEFEGRLLAILEPGVRRSSPSRGAAAAIVVAVALGALPLAAMAPTKPPMAADAAALPGTTAAPTEATGPVRAPAGSPGAPSGPADATDPALPAAGEEGEQQEQLPRDAVEPEANAAPQERRARDLVAALAGVLADPDAEVRQAAVKTLGDLQDTAAVTALTMALSRDDDPEVRATAAWSLGQLESARAIPALSRAVTEDAVAKVRERSAWALGQIEDVGAVPALVRALGDTDAEVRRQAAWALGQIEDASAVPGLTAGLDDADAETRRQVVWALGQIEDPSAVDALAAVVGDEDPEVRERAVWALGQIEDLRAAPALTRALGDSLAEVRMRAAVALGDLDLRSAPEPLLAAARDADPRVRRAVAHTLAEIADPASVPALRILLSDESAEVRRYALRGLGEIGDDAAIQAIVDALSDADPEVRREAARALGRVGGEEL